MLERGKIGEDALALASAARSRSSASSRSTPSRITLADVPVEVRENRRYKEHDDFTIQGAADRLVAEFGAEAARHRVHSIANGSEVKNPLLETSRHGYLSALSASAYSFVSLVQRFGPLLRPGGSFLSLTYMAGERVVPGYGGGMSSAKAALESDTRTLAYEAGRRWGARVNAISAGPWASRAASAIGFIEKMIEYAQEELAAARGDPRGRGRHDRRISVFPAGERHHRHDGLRRQGLPRDGRARTTRESDPR